MTFDTRGKSNVRERERERERERASCQDLGSPDITWTVLDSGTIQIHARQPQSHVHRGAILESLGDPERSHTAHKLQGQTEDGENERRSLVYGAL